MRAEAFMIEPRLVLRIVKTCHVGIVARSEAIALARWPLLDNNAQIVQLLDRSFDVTPHLGAIFCSWPRKLGHRHHASILPRPGRQR